MNKGFSIDSLSRQIPETDPEILPECLVFWERRYGFDSDSEGKEGSVTAYQKENML
jgi:hypothetical protein